jgi:hypothetical protein
MDTSHSGPTELIEVGFDGAGAGRGPLSWGQTAMWNLLAEQRTWLPMGGHKPLDPGTKVDDVVDELRYLMSRFPTMRTKVNPGPEQTVYAIGHATLEVVDAGRYRPEDMAEAVWRRIADAPLDFATEWPIRMAVIRDGDAATHMSVAISHFVADAGGLAVMMAEIAARTVAPVTGTQSLAQAEWQSSPAGRRQDDAAHRYWAAQLRAMPPARPTGLGELRDPRFWLGTLRSPALRGALARLGSDSGHVLLAAYAVAVGEVAGLRPAVIQPSVSNRFRPGLGEVVGVSMQRGLCVLDTADTDFAGLVDRARRASLAASKHAYYHPIRNAALVEAVERERGPEFAPTFHFNDRRIARDGGTSTGPTIFDWIEGRDRPYEPFMIHVDDTGDAVALTVTMDTAVVSAEHAEAVVRSMESTVLSWA